MYFLKFLDRFTQGGSPVPDQEGHRDPDVAGQSDDGNLGAAYPKNDSPPTC